MNQLTESCHGEKLLGVLVFLFRQAETGAGVAFTISEFDVSACLRIRRFAHCFVFSLSVSRLLSKLTVSAKVLPSSY